MLVVLRMNRGFMKFMRTHYSHLITDQHFGHTVVEADHADVVAESAGGPSVVVVDVPSRSPLRTWAILDDGTAP